MNRSLESVILRRPRPRPTKDRVARDLGVRGLWPLRMTLVICIAVAACKQSDTGTIALPDGTAPAVRGEEPPVAVNANPVVEYPAALLEQGIEGTVVLRLFVDTTGAIVPESTQVAESSGYPALDSAALAATPKLKFSPGLRNGQPVAAPFLQPIHFRNPQRGAVAP